MNLQPRQSLAGLRPLSLPVLASLLLHGALLWPDLPRRPVDAPARPQPVTARLAPAPAADSARMPPALVTASHRAGPVALGPDDGTERAGSGAALRSVMSAAATATVPDVPGLPSEGALRALRYALARELAGGELPDLSGLPPTFTVAVHLRARRVIDVTLTGAGGSEVTGGALRAAFKTAAQKAVIPDSLPAEGFSVELELEAGDTERPDHDRPPLPG